MKVTDKELKKYYCIRPIVGGFGIAQKERLGNYRFINTQGNLSEEFFNAFNYKDGFAIVQK